MPGGDTKAKEQQTIGRPRRWMHKLVRDEHNKQRKHHHHAQAKQSDHKQRGSNGAGGSPQVQTDPLLKSDSDGPSSVASRQDARQLSTGSVPAQKASTPILNQSSAQQIHTSHDDSRKQTTIIIAGAVAGGFVLLLALLGFMFFRRRSRKRIAVRAKAAQRIDTAYINRHELTESPADSKFPTLTGSSPSRQQNSRYSIPECLENASRREHVSVSLPRDESARRARQSMDVDESATVSASSKTDDSGDACPSPDSNRRSSSQDGETTLEGDELHIDRCLSYYMKRRTTASVPPEALPHLRSPIPQQQNFVVTPTSAQTPERAVNFPKTVNLLERIRRSQIRLNEEALLKANNEGFRLPKRSPQDEPSEKILGTSPAISEPHSAFEYAEYYDSCLPRAFSGRSCTSVAGSFSQSFVCTVTASLHHRQYASTQCNSQSSITRGVAV